MHTAHNRELPYSVALTRRRRLTSETFELHFTRPPGFAFKPGQKITLIKENIRRDYSLISSPQARELTICVRHVSSGQLTPILDQAEVGDRFQITPPFGFFLYNSTDQRCVFVATGTGIAPFVAFARSGVRGFCLLHGVRAIEQLYYRDVLRQLVESYLPCISDVVKTSDSDFPAFSGRVTDYLEKTLPPGRYDFYLCGRSDMIRDATRIIDRRFSDSRVFTETFY
jgi:benzoate/toluate 1,2-dioxygenase reductase subunit